MIAFTPFVTPLPIWDYWPWLVVPLCLGVAVVYKSTRCRTMREVPRAALVTTCWILAGIAGCAVLLASLSRLLEWN